MESRLPMVGHFGMAEKHELVIPNFLKQWRLHRDLTQEKLGEMSNLTSSSISQIEHGKQGFSTESFLNLCKALDCTPAELIAHDPTRPDSFWPLFRDAERLEGADRKYVWSILKAALAPFEG
jgi:transcriptional regulator with XRE-family HTH domain